MREGSSTRAAYMLLERGFPHVRYLRGGFDAWRRQGYPVEPKASPSRGISP
ncbi:MAG: rhodanese-like domain-containing protein [Vicinamibacteraceae bacterium]